MSAVHMSPTDDSPTRASARVTTRIAMLNKISDRVQQSQEEYQAFHANATAQENPNANLSSQDVPITDGAGDEEDFSNAKSSHLSSLPKYDIETLFELGSKVQDSSKVLLKIQPEAIAENLFQYMGIERSLRPKARSRGLSDATNLSRRSMISSIAVNEWEPSRQPRAAPQASDPKQTSLLQQHEGFVRFLKQHASPPHHRVTAGGRIVPAGPLSPPPMFDYASLNGLLEGQPARIQIPMGIPSDMQDQRVSEAGPSISQSQAQTNYPAFQVNQALANKSLDIGTQNPQQLIWNPNNPSLPQSFALTPLGNFPDGAALVLCNGICYRCLWNGTMTVMEPLTTGQPFLGPNQPILSHHSMPVNNDFPLTDIYGNVNPSKLPQFAGLSFQGAAGIPNTSTLQMLQPTANEPTTYFEENSLKAQLTGLDKYMALHHFDIVPAQRAQLVSRRKGLVEALAKLRLERQPSNLMIPIVSTSNDNSRKSSEQTLVNRNLIETQRQGQNESLNERKDDVASSKKGLSPSAPAFIPKSAVPAYGAGTPMFALAKETYLTSNMPDVPTETKKSGDSLICLPEENQRMRETSSSFSGDKYSIEVDPRDPAMKIVPPSMIKYARKYEPNGPGEEKKFCTTTEEFQEAIRCVREHARMWGCAGGNSKDPAYDAEEDIWYAIKDEAPIPLPTAIPDHFRCPRPWNWYDSLFNINATVDPKILMRGSIFKQSSAQSETAISIKDSPAPTFAAKERRGENVRDQASSQISKISLRELPLESERLRHNLDGHSSAKNKPSREEDSRENHNHMQKSSTRQPLQMKGVTNLRFSDELGHQDRQVIPTHSSNIKDGVKQSNLALSAAQAVYGLPDAEFSRTRKIDSIPRTPLPSPTRAESGAFSQGIHGHTSATPSRETGQMKQGISNGKFLRQTMVFNSVSRPGAENLANPTLNLAESRSSVWAGPEPKAWGSAQSGLTPKDIDAPKVKIPKNYISGPTHLANNNPNHQQLHDLTRSSNDQELGREQSNSSQNASSLDFLKEMLKDPRYSLERQNNYMNSTKERTSSLNPTDAQKVSRSRRENRFAQEIAEREQQDHRAGEKENLTHGAFRDRAEPTSGIGNSVANVFNSDSTLFSTPPMTAGHSNSKVISSMAAATHHAQGFLPSYDGAGKAQAASIHRHQSPRASHNKPRINLPLPPTHNPTYGVSEHSNQPRVRDRSSRGIESRYMPAMFGYDGSEEPAVDENADSKNDKSHEQEKKYTESKGVTTADFENHRPDHDNEWHRGEVNDFFRDLHEKEVKYMMARQRKNTKTAP